MSQKEKMLWNALKCVFIMMDTSTFLRTLFYIEQSMIKEGHSPKLISLFSCELIECYFKEKEEE